MKILGWSYLEEFKKEVRFSKRYFYSDRTTSLFETITSSLDQRKECVPKGKELFRSQIGYTTNCDEDCRWMEGFNENRMKPVPKKTSDGRANSKEIPVLYLSSDEKTSMSELRPPVGAIISCGYFKTNKDLMIVNCYSNKKEYSDGELLFCEPKTQSEFLDRLWYEINYSFSQPVSNDDNSSEYIPTQILAELFRSKGFDGLCCKSHLGPGLNYILFETHYADMEKCVLKEVKAVNYDFNDFIENEIKHIDRHFYAE